MSQDLPGYYDNLNTGVLEAIPADAGLVIEFGCGAGRLGMEFKKQHPGCRYYGVELNAQAAAIAGTRLDMALCGSAEDADLSFVTGQAECLVYADVLEHLVDPWNTLKRHADLLKPGGSVVACIPNIQHWSIIASLMGGSWAYQDNGLMDRTHLRFFTLASIHEMFAGAGLTVDNVTGRVLEHPQGPAYLDALGQSALALGIDAAAFREQANVFQYLVQATRR